MECTPLPNTNVTLLYPIRDGVYIAKYDGQFVFVYILTATTWRAYRESPAYLMHWIVNGEYVVALNEDIGNKIVIPDSFVLMSQWLRGNRTKEEITHVLHALVGTLVSIVLEGGGTNEEMTINNVYTDGNIVRLESATRVGKPITAQSTRTELKKACECYQTVIESLIDLIGDWVDEGEIAETTPVAVLLECLHTDLYSVCNDLRFASKALTTELVTKIVMGAFGRCYLAMFMSLNVVCPYTKTKDIVIPAGDGYPAFSNCMLTQQADEIRTGSVVEVVDGITVRKATVQKEYCELWTGSKRELVVEKLRLAHALSSLDFAAPVYAIWGCDGMFNGIHMLPDITCPLLSSLVKPAKVKVRELLINLVHAVLTTNIQYGMIHGNLSADTIHFSADGKVFITRFAHARKRSTNEDTEYYALMRNLKRITFNKEMTKYVRKAPMSLPSTSIEQALSEFTHRMK